MSHAPTVVHVEERVVPVIALLILGSWVGTITRIGNDVMVITRKK